MKNRRRIIMGMTGILAAVLIVWLAVVSAPSEPRYKGRSLSQWLETYEVPPQLSPPGAWAEATDAIQHIGTNAIPSLVAWIQDKEMSPWQFTMAKVVYHVYPDWTMPTSFGFKLRRAQCVPEAFAALGPKAKSAVPELTRLANSTNDFAKATFATTARFATMALARLGKDGLPPFLGLMTNQDPALREIAIESTRYLGTNAVEAIPILLQYYNPDRDHKIAAVLGELKMQPDLVVPALTNGLLDSEWVNRKFAVEALANFGANACLAAPALTNALNDPVGPVREAVTNALLKIAPEALANGSRSW